jgi:hypothetical protein
MAINDYSTPDLIRTVLTDGDASRWSGEYDALVTAAITKASRLVDALLKRKPGAFYMDTDETRYYTGSGTCEQWIDELAAAPTTVSVAETGDITNYTAWSSTDYMLWPENALLDGMPYLRMDLDTLYGSKAVWYRFPRSIKVVGKFGFAATTPGEIAKAVEIQVVRWFKRGQQGFQDIGAVAELGQLRYVQELDPDVRTLLSAPKFSRVTI